MIRTNYHPGMRMVQASLNAQRACNEAIIFAYGSTGAGKTSSLNHLFDSEIIPKSKKGSSDTHAVSEFVSVMSSPKWEVTNLEIGFIDLPGWGDTQGDAQDARNLAAIEQFTIGHLHLGSKLYKCYPNIILIAFNVMEERLEGPESNAAKMLRMLNELCIVDIKRPNVIVVLTHAMSLPPLNFKESLREIERCIKTLTRTFLKVEASVVYVENNTSGFLMKKEGEWTVLADGTLQPKNLFDEMINLMSDSGDEVGVEAVRLYFQNRGSNKPIERRRVETNCVSRTSEEKWRATIIRNIRKIVETEVLRRIKVYQREHPEITPDRLLPLTFELNKAGFMKKSDLESYNVDEVEDFLVPYLLNELEKKILMEVFGVRSRTLPNLVNSIGRGFDTDSRIFCHPILKPMTDYYITNGVNVPTCMRAVPLEELIVDCRIEKLNVKDPSSNISKLHIEPKDCSQPKLKPASICPISPITSEAKYFPDELDVYKFIFTVTRNIMNIQFVIYNELVKQVSEEFVQDINELPLNFTMPDKDIVVVDDAYKQFFMKYGQHFVLGCNSGGQIIGELNVKCRDQDVIPTKAIIQQYVNTYLSTLQSTTTKTDYKFDEELFNKILQAPLTWEGGIKPEFCESLRDINSALWYVWNNSLKQKSNILTDLENNLRLIPIYHFVSCISKPISEQLKEAISVLCPGIHLFDTQLTIEETPTLEGSVHTEGYGPYRKRTLSRRSAISSLPAMTRDKAADQADTGGSDHSKGGFPGNAKVWQRGVNARPIQVDMQTIKEGDHLLCANAHGSVHYELIEHLKKEEKKHVQYRTISDGVYKVTIGFKHLVVNGGLSSATVAGDLKLGSQIFSVAYEANEAKPTVLRTIGITTEVGNYIPIMERGNIIVNGIVCENPDNCFPGNASVVLRGGEKVRMDELKIGDYVLSIHPTTGKSVYSKVYLWAHRDPHITATFLHITHPHGHLHISANHLILSGDKRIPVPADQLRVGDSVHFLSPCLSQQQLNGQEGEEGGDSHTLISVPVLHMQTCTQAGYYAPFTINGLIVVDDIATSVYSHISTHSQSDSSSSSSSWLWSGVWHSVTSGLVQQFGMHRVGQCVLTPVRVGCKLGVGSMLSHQMDTNTHIHKYCQWLLAHF